MPEGLSYEEWLATKYIPIAGGEFQAGESAPDSGGDGGDSGDAGDGDSGDGGEGGDKSGDPPDVKQAIDNLSERMENFMQGMQSQQEDPLDFLDDDFDDFEDDGKEQPDAKDGGDDPNDLMRSADQIVEDLVEKKVQERMAPHLQQQYEERRHERVVALEERYPELKETEQATPLLRQAAQLAKSLGEPELAREADFLETVHLRMKAEAARNEETSNESGQDDEAPIEGAGGSGNGGGSKNAQQEAAKLIVGAREDRGIF